MIEKPLQRPTTLDDVVLVTHHGCLDGAGCALAFIRAGGSNENIVYVNPGGVDRWVNNNVDIDAFVVFADVAPRDIAVIDMLAKRGRAVVLDHHRTSLCLSDVPFCAIDMDRSGAVLAADYFGVLDGHLATIVSLIDDHDRWQGRFAESDDIAILHKGMGTDAFVSRLASDSTTSFRKEELFLIECTKRSRSHFVKKMLSSVRDAYPTVDGKRVKVGCVVASEHISYLLHEVLLADRTLAAAAALDFTNCSVSLRSLEGGLDVSKFAEERGGGGHANAAAFKMNCDMSNVIGEII